MLYSQIPRESIEPSGARMRAQHLESLVFALGKARSPSGDTTGGTPERPQNVIIFSKFFQKKHWHFWGRSGVRPAVAPEEGSALPRVKPSLPQCS